MCFKLQGWILLLEHFNVPVLGIINRLYCIQKLRGHLILKMNLLRFWGPAGDYRQAYDTSNSGCSWTTSLQSEGSWDWINRSKIQSNRKCNQWVRPSIRVWWSHSCSCRQASVSEKKKELDRINHFLVEEKLQVITRAASVYLRYLR